MSPIPGRACVPSESPPCLGRGPAASIAGACTLLALRSPAWGPGEALEGLREPQGAAPRLFATTGQPS
jgi:hypothetical protein